MRLPQVKDPRVTIAWPADERRAFWVFGYGSLMWRPGFDYEERRPATLNGFKRGFCLWSVRYRGTPAAPGLVLGLAPADGATVNGVAYRVAADRAPETRAYLAERELVTAAYHEVAAPIAMSKDDAASTDESAGDSDELAITYVVDPSHRQSAAHLTAAEQAEIIARSCGPMGPNCEYLFNTVAHLREMGVSDPELEALERQVRALQRR